MKSSNICVNSWLSTTWNWRSPRGQSNCCPFAIVFYDECSATLRSILILAYAAWVMHNNLCAEQKNLSNSFLSPLQASTPSPPAHIITCEKNCFLPLLNAFSQTLLFWSSTQAKFKSSFLWFPFSPNPEIQPYWFFSSFLSLW